MARRRQKADMRVVGETLGPEIAQDFLPGMAPTGGPLSNLLERGPAAPDQTMPGDEVFYRLVAAEGLNEQVRELVQAFADDTGLPIGAPASASSNPDALAGCVKACFLELRALRKSAAMTQLGTAIGAAPTPSPAPPKKKRKPPTPTGPVEEPAVALPSLKDLLGRSDFPADDVQEIERLAVRLIQLQEQTQQIELERKGSGKHTESWYDGPAVAGIVTELGALFAQYSLPGIRIENFTVRAKDQTHVTLSMLRLVELGVDPDLIEKAKTSTTSFTVEVRRQKKRSRP
jgi:hypothetical protein